MANSVNSPPIQSNDIGAEVSQGFSIAWAVVTCVVVFILLMLFPLGTYFVIPKFKTIFADMLGPGESLPAFTEIVLRISDTFKNNAIILLPVYLLLSAACAGFIGFQRYFLPSHLSKIIRVIFFVLCMILLICPVIAMFLPLIKMMDKLGQ